LAVLELGSADRDGYARTIELLQAFGIPLHSAIEEYVADRSLLKGQFLLPTLQEYVGRRRSVTDKPVLEIVDELLESRKHALRSKRYIQTLRSHLSRFANRVSNEHRQHHYGNDRRLACIVKVGAVRAQ
jgi:hypothetical protein